MRQTMKKLPRRAQWIIAASLSCWIFTACAGEDGKNGVDGAHVSVQTTILETDDEHCANGGVKIEFLINDAIQENQTQYICNGTTGAPGIQGTPGADGVCANNMAPEVETELKLKPLGGDPSSLTLISNKAGLQYQFVAPGLMIEPVGAETVVDEKYISIYDVTPMSSGRHAATIIASDGCQIAMREIQLNITDPGLEFVSIPAGSLSSDSGSTISLYAFKLAKTPTTLAQFMTCVEAGACSPENYSTATNDPLCNYERGEDWLNHPMNCVNWHGSTEFCAWVGGRLPNKDEWAFAATHDGTSALQTTYPWGNDSPTHCGHANYLDATRSNPYCDGAMEVSSSVGSSAVGSYSPLGDSPLGLQDMSGNVWEWTSSPGPDENSDYWIKGGSYGNSALNLFVSSDDEHDASSWHVVLGFRCAKDEEQSLKP